MIAHPRILNQRLGQSGMGGPRALVGYVTAIPRVF
jgi:hypothetical protein